MSDNHPYLNFDEYIRQGEPSQKEKALNWETAIGLQAVDGLRVSDYLRETAQKHIVPRPTVPGTEGTEETITTSHSHHRCRSNAQNLAKQARNF
jgi:hypothetical protein